MMLPIDIDRISRIALLAGVVIFFGLWRYSEAQTNEALEVAQTSVETARQCIATYKASARSMSDAIDNLHGLEN